MEQNSSRLTGPLQNLYVDIKKILDNMVIKDMVTATQKESEASSSYGRRWIDAIKGTDDYMSYVKWWTLSMFQELNNSITENEFTQYKANPSLIPLRFRESILEKGREAFLSSYEEKNDYYRMLIGLPNVEDIETYETDLYAARVADLTENYIEPHKDAIRKKDPTLGEDEITRAAWNLAWKDVESKLYNLSTDGVVIIRDKEVAANLQVPLYTPVHQLSVYAQNKYVNTDEYKKYVKEYPDWKYLLYIGNKKVDLYTARMAKDFDIIRYPADKTDINPNLLNTFLELYDEYREYVMVVLYNTPFVDIYPYYRTFMGVLITSFVLLQIGNKAVEAVNTKNFLDDSILYIMLSMYGIPDSLIMTRNVRRDLVIHLLKLVREKGTNDVYYDLVDILGYQDIAISKLMLMKGQQFVDDINRTASTEVKPYFLQIDLKDDNPYDTIAAGNAPTYSLEEITSGDQTWWQDPNDPEDPVTKILRDSNYSMVESKYIVVEAIIHSMEYMFESIYLSNMILDNKLTTDTFTVEVPELFGSEQISIYDITLALLCASILKSDPTHFDWTKGSFAEYNDLQAIAGFNFNLNMESFNEFLDTCKYVEKERLITFLNHLEIENSSDISRLYTDVIHPLREWLERKVSYASTREEFLEYESIYRAIFTYDIAHNSVVEDMNFKIPLEVLQNEYELTSEQMNVYKHFYPREMTGEAITDETFLNSRYAESYEFLSNIPWKIRIVLPSTGDDRGFVYFHDILNYDDIREIPIKRVAKGKVVETGEYVFKDIPDGVNWVINDEAVAVAIREIEKLDDTALADAYIVLDTPVDRSGQSWYRAGTPLPKNLREPGVWKDILKRKIEMDVDGLSEPPTTYFELLRRKNSLLYNKLFSPSIFNANYSGDRTYYTPKDENEWTNTVMTLILAMETELSIHAKYYEQSIIGKDLFFKPLITLINHFKSMMVHIAKTGVKYIFDSKMDAGGNSNMIRLFDTMKMTIHFTTIAQSGYGAELGLYDVMHSTKFKLIFNDRMEMYREQIGSGFAAEYRDHTMGSIHLTDECKFFKNGKPIDDDDPAMWYNGEPGNGRWSEDDDVLFKTRTKNARVISNQYDFDAWKDTRN